MRNLALGGALLAVLGACGIACGSGFNGTDEASGGDGDAAAGDGSSAGDGSGVDPLMNGDGGPLAPKDAGPGGGPMQQESDGSTPLDGIFVSTSLGNDMTGDGSQKAPFLTLTKALPIAKSKGKSVLACSETYTETLTLLDGVSIFADYDCTAGWASVKTKNAVLMSPTSPGIIAVNLTKGLTVGHLDVTVPASTGAAAPNSVGIFVSNSPLVAFDSLVVTTGDGWPGTDQAEPTQLVTDGTATATGRAAGTNGCGASGYSGGSGGGGGQYGWTCQASPHTWKLTSMSSASTGTVINPVNGTDGTSSAGGTFTNDVNVLFAPGNGTAGTNGVGGSGHDGFAGDNIAGTSCAPLATGTTTTTTGFGGGAGGCPGLAGLAGTGGGSSIGMIAFGAVTVGNITFQLGSGGKGGKGTGGSSATNGGNGGGTAGTPPGLSGSGAGGHSIGIAYKTTTPPTTKLPNSTTLGTAGPGVAAFTSADGLRTVPKSSDGVAASTYAFP